MVERLSSIFARVAPESSLVTPQEVSLAFERTNHCAIPENIARMINLYPYWCRKILTPQEVGQLVWYLRKDPNHISWKLTQGGRNRRVEQVARVFLKPSSDSLINEWSDASKVVGFLETLKKGEKLPPLIIVKGSRYPDSPDSSFIDGVHRALAIAIFHLTYPQNNFEVEAYVGQKPSLPLRLLRRLNTPFSYNKDNLAPKK